jgi:5'-phosphate synthase pdxT subunit
VLALQGDVAEHCAALERSGALASSVRRAGDLDGLDALVLPGGESTTIGLLTELLGLREPLARFVASGRPVWGTCAGMILLARDVGHAQPLLGGMDIHVDRNAFGRQVDSFETDLQVEGLPGGSFRAVFIRAPAIRAAGPEVEVLARLPDGRIVAARQGSLWATSFHPELAEDDRLHAAFVECVRDRLAQGHAPA